ncbi:MAG: DUF2510 domain-containing protein [Nocardioides sp.]
MSQAPAGWHLQPDGRERYWDGTQWTAHFRPGPAQQAPDGQPQADPVQQGYPQPGYQQPGYAGYQQAYPQQGYGPAYPQQGYAPGYQGTPSSGSSNTTKIVLIVIGVLILVLGGGCLAVATLVGGAVNEAVETIESEDSQPGGPDNPLEITEGEAFEVSGFEYDPGWAVVGDLVDGADIEGLKVTNNRDNPDSAFVEIKLWSGNEVLATVDCYTDDIAVGTKVSVDCSSFDDLPASYDRITINDTF